MALAKQNVKSQPAAPTYVSLSPDDATQGGLIDDIDVEVIDAATCEWDYNGQQPAGPAVAIQFQDPNGATHDQYYSAGKAEDWAPTESGEGFVAVSGKTGFNNSTNLMKFFTSLVEAGFPKEILAQGNVKAIIGLKCHVNQVVQERKGLIRTGKNADRPTTCLLVSKIHSLPGADTAKPPVGKGKPASTVAKGGKPNGAATSDAASEIDTVLTEKLIEALAETDPLPKKALLQIASAAFKGTPNHSKAIARTNDAVFLRGLAESGVKFEGAEFSLA